MSNYRLFKISFYSGLANVVVKYAKYKAMSSISFQFQKLEKYLFLITTIFAIS
jgi:hypothetical protein